MKKKILLISASVSILVSLLIFQNYFSADQDKAVKSGISPEAPAAAEMATPTLKFGLPVDSFEVVESVVQKGESFGNILLSYGIDYPTINRIASEFKEVFDVRYLRSGKPYAMFCENNDTAKVARYMVYQSSPVHYTVFDFTDSVQVYTGEKEVETRIREVSGDINSSLYEALMKQDAPVGLAIKLADVYAWTIDFFHIQKGDYFKAIYEEKYIDDSVFVGVGRILACNFNHGERDFYSFYYEKDEKYKDYFDEEGECLRKAFLRAPLNYSRISSRYSPRRYHPVLKRVKAHLGTDYAAAHGTPIMSTADGEVIAASYTRGNGNYVKIRHNSTYTTQYLHMSRFAKGMKTGKIVKQGEVIGYVGSTGLATGPHVCYRFWKNGRQVDPYKQDLPEAEPIKEEYREEYLKMMEPLKKRLDNIRIERSSSERMMAAEGSKGRSTDA